MSQQATAEESEIRVITQRKDIVRRPKKQNSVENNDVISQKLMICFHFINCIVSNILILLQQHKLGQIHAHAHTHTHTLRPFAPSTHRQIENQISMYRPLIRKMAELSVMAPKKLCQGSTSRIKRRRHVKLQLE